MSNTNQLILKMSSKAVLKKLLLITDITEVITAGIDYYKLKEIEQTKRLQIQAEFDLIILPILEKIETNTSILTEKFPEWQQSIEYVLQMQRKAIETQDSILLQVCSDTLVRLHQHSPVSELV